MTLKGSTIRDLKALVYKLNNAGTDRCELDLHEGKRILRITIKFEFMEVKHDKDSFDYIRG